MQDAVNAQILSVLPHVQSQAFANQEKELREIEKQAKFIGGGDGSAKGTPASVRAKNASGKKIGRNDPCWCGSGKKYKNCHGK